MVQELLQKIGFTYIEIAPYLFIGLLFAGFLNVFVKKDFISRHLGKNNFLSVIKASLLGVPLPLCSCGVIPTALHLRKKNASKGATLSFLISTPQTGVDSIIATYGMLGPVFAIFRPVAAFITGILGGFSVNLMSKKDRLVATLENENCSSCSIDIQGKKTIISRLKNLFSYAFIDFLDDISLQLVVGIILAGIISFVVPDNFFERYGGNGIIGMLFMILIGIPLYVCATGSIPIAVSLLAKGISPGGAFAFLVAGPATNAATITLIINALGKKITVIYLGTIIVFSILGGLLLNWIHTIFNLDFTLTSVHHNMQINLWEYILTTVFSIFLILSLIRKVKSKWFKQEISGVIDSKSYTFPIIGMTCKHCVQHVQEAINEISGVKRVKVNLEEKKAIIYGDFSKEKVISAIKKAGYKTSYQ